MAGLVYHRSIIGYHGCDVELAEKVLLGKATIDYSGNLHDWLGKGIYFWEHGPSRAMEWAADRATRTGKIKSPSVIGAHILLGECFDLLDTRYTKVLADLYPAFEKSFRDHRLNIPQNKSPKGQENEDLVCRYLDCAVMNWCLDRFEKEEGIRFHTVRGVFTEGKPAFPGSAIKSKSHIQIAVRDPDCILGYFRPTHH